MASTNFQNICEIAKVAYEMTSIDDMIKFVEAENAKLAHSLDTEDLNRMLNKISIHIRKNQNKSGNGKHTGEGNLSFNWIAYGLPGRIMFEAPKYDREVQDNFLYYHLIENEEV